MRNRQCPSHIACWDYEADNCEGCTVGTKILKLSRKVKRLQGEIDKSKQLIQQIDRELTHLFDEKFRVQELSQGGVPYANGILDCLNTFRRIVEDAK